MNAPPVLSVAELTALPTRSALVRLWSRFANAAYPLLSGLGFLAIWESFVRLFAVQPYVLPAPSAIGASLWANRGSLAQALLNTGAITVSAFSLAVISGLTLGTLITQSRVLEKVIWPYAVALQVTPVVAIAPLIIIWVGLSHAWLALLILSWLVAFFPMLSSTVIGIKSVDKQLRNLFVLYGATRRQTLFDLELPGALPYILSGARISAGLSVIGAVVAEFVAGTGTSNGLAWIIVESGNALDVPRMFAALTLLSGFGIAIWQLLTALQTRLLQNWHDSELPHE